MNYIKLEDMTEEEMLETLRRIRANRKKGIEVKQKRKKTNETEEFLNNLPEDVKKVLLDTLMKGEKDGKQS